MNIAAVRRGRGDERKWGEGYGERAGGGTFRGDGGTKGGGVGEALEIRLPLGGLDDDVELDFVDSRVGDAGEDDGIVDLDVSTGGD